MALYRRMMDIWVVLWCSKNQTVVWIGLFVKLKNIIVSSSEDCTSVVFRRGDVRVKLFAFKCNQHQVR